MDEVIRARGGERIVPAEYPVGYVDRLNARLNAIAEEPDMVGPTRYRMPVAWLWAIILAVAVYLVVVVLMMVAGLAQGAPVETPAPVDVQLPTIGYDR